ncbi:hypothetical protein HPP92_020022 [Vanilla planifolia]|uniref:AIPP2-like SPOC-like domain-containing protein n=1 Tax=Vanilla planifolia TaxID=51239 RepID=A0A835QBG1_VANPL|nr:hypothetical protein HPP92_020022 [Vanilla planifolia]
MEIGGRSFADKVCHTCGHLGIPAAIITCSLCNMSTIHTYCMRLVPPEVPEVWQCDDCLLNSGVIADKQETIKQEESFSIIGSNFGKHEKQKSLQNSSSRKIATGKVKFISTKEVTGLTLGIRSVRRGSYWGHHLMRGKSIPTLRETIPPTSPNSKELSISFRLKNCHALAELHPSMDKMANQYVNQKRGMEAAAEICRKKSVEEFKPPLKLQDGCGFMKDHPNASLAVMKGKKLNETIVVANVSPVNNSGIVISSILQCNKISDQEMSHPLKIVFSSDEKHQYALEVCWRGVFEVVDMLSQVHGVCAHFASQVSPKVYDFSKQLPRTLKFKVLPRESVWPKIFKLQSPTKDDIALYFMCEVERHKEKYDRFVQHINSHDYALKSCIADVKLLLFTSARLQTDSQSTLPTCVTIFFELVIITHLHNSFFFL